MIARPQLCNGGATQLGDSMYRAGWGQSVRTEHHLALRKGSRGGGSEKLDLDLDLAGVRHVVPYLLPPVPRRHALGEHLRDTDTDAAG